MNSFVETGKAHAQKIGNKAILTILLIFSAVLVSHAETKAGRKTIWETPLSAEYHNIEFPYETVVSAVECLEDKILLAGETQKDTASACLKSKLKRDELNGQQDDDENAYQRTLWSGPPKKGPVTVIRIIRVGKTKSLMQIQSSKWHPIFGSRETEELSKRRLKEILSLISNAEG